MTTGSVLAGGGDFGWGFIAPGTLSRLLDYHGYNQEAESLISNGYNYRLDYAPDAADRTHVFNSNFYYELPFGPGKALNIGGVGGKIIGGWTLTGNDFVRSGDPLGIGVNVASNPITAARPM